MCDIGAGFSSDKKQRSSVIPAAGRSDSPPLPAAAAVSRLRGFATEGEGIEAVGDVAYLHTPGGLCRSKLAEKFNKGIGVVNSARNWNTILRLMELVRKAAEA